MKGSIYFCKGIIFCILAYFFVITEISLFQLLIITYPIIYLWGFIALEIIIALLFIGYVILRSGRMMFLFSSFICLISCFGFIFLFIIQKSSFTELIPKTILIVIFLAGLILIRLKFIPERYNVLFMLMNYGASLGLLILTYNRPFFLTKLELFLLYILSYNALKISFNNLGYRSHSHLLFLHNHITQYFLIGTILFSTIMVFGSVSYIEINANNSPEIIFWSSAVELPDDEETLDYCYDHDIGFCVVLREHYIEDGGLSEKEHIEYLLNHSVITYICLGGGKDEFYLTTDNGDDFYDIFHTIKTWLISNNLYNYGNLRGFVVDAEIPKSYYEDLSDTDIYEKGEYYVNQLPTQNKLDKIQDKLNDMIEEIQDDDKVCGIIKLPTMFDNLDLDDDFNQLSNTIYDLPLDWDFSVSMNYRTMHIPTWQDYLIRDMSKYDYTSDYEPAYLQKDQLERNIVPLSTFYQEVAYEVYHSDVDVSQSHRYIFIGTYTRKFKDTSYIQNDEWKKDLDVCRHFGVSKVWIYEYSGFKRFYSLASLVRHNEHDQKWILVIPTYMITRELFVALSNIVIDKFLNI